MSKIYWLLTDVIREPDEHHSMGARSYLVQREATMWWVQVIHVMLRNRNPPEEFYLCGQCARVDVLPTLSWLQQLRERDDADSARALDHLSDFWKRDGGGRYATLDELRESVNQLLFP